MRQRSSAPELKKQTCLLGAGLQDSGPLHGSFPELTFSVLQGDESRATGIFGLEKHSCLLSAARSNNMLPEPKGHVNRENTQSSSGVRTDDCSPTPQQAPWVML